MKTSVYCSYVCKAWCCKHISVEYNGMDLDNATKQFLSLRNISIDEDNFKLIIPNRCKWLNTHNKCMFYEHRPTDCKTYECKALSISSKK